MPRSAGAGADRVGRFPYGLSASPRTCVIPSRSGLRARKRHGSCVQSERTTPLTILQLFDQHVFERSPGILPGRQQSFAERDIVVETPYAAQLFELLLEAPHDLVLLLDDRALEL